MSPAQALLKPAPVTAVALLVLTMGIAGCVSDDVQADVPEPKVVDVHLGLTQVMFHPAEGVMLTAWTFYEFGTSPPTTYEPLVIEANLGDTIRVRFTNTHDFNHTIHWHGLWVPWEMDGVPFMTQDPIEPGESFVYSFEAKPVGTHLFHCHVDTPHHVDMGMSGMIVVKDPNEPYHYDREEHMLLDDWDSSHLHQSGTGASADGAQMTVDSAKDPSGDPFNQIDRTEQQVRDAYNNPPNYPVVKDTDNPARRNRTDYPVTYAPWQPQYDVYTINGRSFPHTQPLMIDEGETIRVRMANIGNSIFSMHLHGHGFKVTHKDGFPLDSPYMADTLPIHPGERYDIMIRGDNPGVWMFHDHNGLHAMTQNIYPGGAGTTLVYTAFEAGVGAGGDHAHHRGTSEGGATGIGSLGSGDGRTTEQFLGLYRR